MATVRWKDKPVMVALAGTEVMAASSVAGGAIVGGGTVAANDDIHITPDQLAAFLLASITKPNAFVNVALGDMTTAIAAGTKVAQWIAPEAGTLVDVWLGVDVVSSSGVVRIDLNNSGGTSMLSTRPAIDASEANSLTGTAAVLTGTLTFAKGAKFTFDIDDAGTGAKGPQAVIEYAPA